MRKAGRSGRARGARALFSSMEIREISVCLAAASFLFRLSSAMKVRDCAAREEAKRRQNET